MPYRWLVEDTQAVYYHRDLKSSSADYNIYGWKVRKGSNLALKPRADVTRKQGYQWSPQKGSHPWPGGTPSLAAGPHPDLARGYPIPGWRTSSWPGQGVSHPWQGVPIPGQGGTPSWPGWGVPPSLPRGVPHPDLSRGYPIPGWGTSTWPGQGVSHPWQGVPIPGQGGYPILTWLSTPRKGGGTSHCSTPQKGHGTSGSIMG